MSYYYEIADLAGEYAHVFLTTTISATDCAERVAPLPKN